MDRLIEETEFKTSPKWEYNKFWLEDDQWIFWEGGMHGISHSNVMRGLDVGNSTDAVWGYYRKEEDELEALCELDSGENPPQMTKVLQTFPDSTVTWNGETVQWQGSQDPKYLSASKEAKATVVKDGMPDRNLYNKFLIWENQFYIWSDVGFDISPAHIDVASSLNIPDEEGNDVIFGSYQNIQNPMNGNWSLTANSANGIVDDQLQIIANKFPWCNKVFVDRKWVNLPSIEKEAATPPFNRTVLYDLVKFIGLNGTTVDYGEFYESTSADEEEARSVLEILTEAGAMDKVEEYTFEVDPVKFKELLSAIDEEEQIDTDPLLELFEQGVNKPRMPESKIAIDSVDPSGEEWDGAMIYSSPEGLGNDLKFIITDSEDMFWKFPRENSGEPEHITIANTFDINDEDNPMFGYYASARPIHLEKVEVWGDQQEPDENKVAKLLGYFGDKVIRWNGKRLFIREDGSYFWDKLAKISMISEDRMYSSPVPDKPNKFLILDDEVYFWELTDTGGTDFFVRPTHSDAAYTISKYYENPVVFLAGAINLSEEIMEFSGLLVPPQSMALNDMEDPDEGILEYMPEQIQDVIPSDVMVMSQRELNDYSNQYAMEFESKLASVEPVATLVRIDKDIDGKTIFGTGILTDSGFDPVSGEEVYVAEVDGNKVYFTPENASFCPIYESYQGQDYEELMGLVQNGNSYVWIESYDQVAVSHKEVARVLLNTDLYSTDMVQFIVNGKNILKVFAESEEVIDQVLIYIDPIKPNSIEFNGEQISIEAKLAQDQDFSDSIMVALVPPENIRNEIAIEGGEDEDNLHVTLAYVPDFISSHSEELEKLEEIVNAWYEDIENLQGSISGYGTFQNDETHVLWASVDIPGIDDIRHDLAEGLEEAFDVDLDEKHGFSPHMTLKTTETMSDESFSLPQLPESVQDDFEWIPIIAIGGEWIELPTDGSGENKTADLDWENLYQQIESPFIDDQTGEISFYTDELMQSGSKGWVEPDGTYYVWDAMSSDRFYGVVGDHHGQAMLAKEFNGKNWQDLSQDMKEEFYGSGAGFRDAWIKLYNVSILECSPSGDEFVVVGKDATQEQKESIAYLLDRLRSNPSFISIELGTDVAEFDNKDDAGEWLVTGELPEDYGDDFDVYSQKQSSILSPIHQELADNIWDLDMMTIEPELKEFIWQKIDDALSSYGLYDEHLKRLYIIGSITGRQYDFDSDVDINLYIDIDEWAFDLGEDPEDLRNSVRKSLVNQNGDLPPDSTHPVNFFLSSTMEDPPADGIYDVLDDMWVKHPDDDYPQDFNPYEDFKEAFERAEELAQRVDNMWGKAMRANEAYLLYGDDSFRDRYISYLNELVETYKTLAQERRDVFDIGNRNNIDVKALQRSNANVIYKALEKWGIRDKMVSAKEALKQIEEGDISELILQTFAEKNPYYRKKDDEDEDDDGNNGYHPASQDGQRGEVSAFLNKKGVWPPKKDESTGRYPDKQIYESQEDHEDLIESFEEWSNTLSPEEREAYNQYIPFVEPNLALRQNPNTTFDDDEYRKNIMQGLDSSIQRGKVPEDMMSYRGYYNSWLTQMFDEDNIVGYEFTDPAYTSCTVDLDVAKDFADEDGVVMDFVLPEGTPIAYIPALTELELREKREKEKGYAYTTGEDFDPFYKQYELLLPRNTTFKIVDSWIDNEDVRRVLAEPYFSGSSAIASLSKEGEEGEIVGYDKNDIWVREMDWATFVDIDDETIKEFSYEEGYDEANLVSEAIDYARSIWDGEGKIILVLDEGGEYEDITPEVASM